LAISASLSQLQGVFVDNQGNVYFSDTLNHRIRFINATNGIISTIAGTGVRGSIGDAGLAISAQLNNPVGIFVDNRGNVYFCDSGNNKIRFINAINGIISTIAGTGVQGNTGDGGLATNAQLSGPTTLFLKNNQVYITVENSNSVKTVNLITGIISTIAGNFIVGGPASRTVLNQPKGIFVDNQRNVYFCDFGGNTVYKINATNGIISKIAGTGVRGSIGDGGLAISAQLNNSTGIFVDNQGNVYFCDSGNNKIRFIYVTNGNTSTIAGTGVQGNTGDGGLAVNATLNEPTGIFVDNQGNVYFCDSGNNKIRFINVTNGNISTIAGSGIQGNTGDGGLAVNATLNEPTGIFVDNQGNVYFCDTLNRQVRFINVTNGNISTIAGSGIQGNTGDGGLAVNAALNEPTGIFVDNQGNVYFCDSGNNRIQFINAVTRIISTIAGTGIVGFNGENVSPSTIQLNFPYGIFIFDINNQTKEIYFTEVGNSRVRKFSIDVTSIVIPTPSSQENATVPSPISSNDNLLGIILPSILVPLFVLALIAIILFFAFKRRKIEIEKNSVPLQILNLNSQTKVAESKFLKDIEAQEKIGSGAFGSVYKGMWNKSVEVALKTIGEENKGISKDFLNEVELLEKLKHPNIVQFFGVYYDPKNEEHFIVMEFMNKGSLLSLLRQNVNEFSSDQLVELSAQVCKGMIYLESQKIIHRDLACRNVLISTGKNKPDFIVKVSDFGMSKMAQQYYYNASSKNNIPVKWSSPEAIQRQHFSSKSDVWSFGVLIWEIFSFGIEPYSGFSNVETIEKITEDNYRMPNPNKKACSNQIYQLMLDCWKSEVNERPNFQQIYEVLNFVLMKNENRDSVNSNREGTLDPTKPYVLS
jgi:sugar lactone lactonase YvrE